MFYIISGALLAIAVLSGIALTLKVDKLVDERQEPV